ncbi:hypothetical protein RJ639_037531, partial [Escallonia herrerae]
LESQIVIQNEVVTSFLAKFNSAKKTPSKSGHPKPIPITHKHLVTVLVKIGPRNTTELDSTTSPKRQPDLIRTRIPTKTLPSTDGSGELRRLRLKNKKMEEDGSSNGGGSGRNTPLSQVVSDCVKRWFQDTLKEAKAGDLTMQVLVAQMYYSGYGVSRDAQKGRIWMTRASRVRSSVWKVSNKRPGYNASDSDSDELIGDS